MKQHRLTARCLASGFAVGILLFFSIYRNPVQAVQGTATFTGTSQELTGDITAGRLVDQANTDYYIDPAASGNSLITAGAASVSGNLVLNAAATIQTTNMQPLTIGSATTGLTKVTSGGMLQLQAGGTGTGSTGTASIFFLNSSGTTAGRFETIGTISTSSPVNATGGTITTSGGYTIHTFTTSGTFTPGVAGNVEYLVVAGGGGGGGGYGAGSSAGGGGAGGFRTNTGYAVTGQGYTVTVGGGGGGGSGAYTPGYKGSDSTFDAITSTGGGGGAGYYSSSGTGGSGGGGSSNSNYPSAAGNTPSTNPSQGNNGGNGSASSTYSGGGGGGSGGAGTAASSGTGGSGGAGTASSISGSSVTYAGGGGGAGGTAVGTVTGGGGLGRVTVGDGYSGSANTGGGGGGGVSQSSSTYVGGNGGSGIVIIRYPTANYGTLYLSSNNTSSQDLAEYYVSGDSSIEAGDVVTLSTSEESKPTSEVNGKGVLQKATKPYDRKLIGIISTNPGVLMGSIDGENKEDKRMLALSGRVPVKIDPDSTAIAIGDFLTSGSRPGLAAKATRPGYVVARALEAWKPGGPATIEAFIQLTYYMGDIDPWGNFRTLEVDTLKVNKTLEVGGVNILDRITKQQEEIDALKASIRKLEKTQY